MYEGLWKACVPSSSESKLPVGSVPSHLAEEIDVDEIVPFPRTTHMLLPAHIF